MRNIIVSLMGESWESRLALVDQMNNLVAICRNGDICYINKAGAHMLGFSSPKQVLGEAIANFFHEDYKDTAKLGMEVFAEDKTLMFVKFTRLDSKEVEVEMRVEALDFEGETTYMLQATDITQHLRTARALRSREQRLEGILNTVADGIITINDDGGIQTFNPAAEKIFGFKKEEVIGKNIRVLLPETIGVGLSREFGAEWASILSFGNDLVGVRKDGEIFPMEMAVRELNQGENLTFTSIVRDITARKKAEEKVYNLAHFDHLTGLPNRYLLGDRLDEALKRAGRSDRDVALMFIDLDKFKTINDTIGHSGGDQGLMEVASRLRNCIRNTDTVARVGGDEFVVLLEELHHQEETTIVAEKIMESLQTPFIFEGHEFLLSASIGISIYPEHATDVTHLMICADRAMYQVKRDRKSGFAVYLPDMSMPSSAE
ncbi:MAG: diguanylate cyclase [Rhodospirillales bacterium]|nr:diguanylate cyclase [Rhodospirillales bacterium]